MGSTLPHGEKPAKAHDGKRNFAAPLIDHTAVDASNLFPSGAIDRCSFHLVARDQGVRFARSLQTAVPDLLGC